VTVGVTEGDFVGLKNECVSWPLAADRFLLLLRCCSLILLSCFRSQGADLTLTPSGFHRASEELMSLIRYPFITNNFLACVFKQVGWSVRA
jgi:hypothetical protein